MIALFSPANKLAAIAFALSETAADLAGAATPLASATADMISTKADNHADGAQIILFAPGINKSRPREPMRLCRVLYFSSRAQHIPAPFASQFPATGRPA